VLRTWDASIDLNFSVRFSIFLLPLVHTPAHVAFWFCIALVPFAMDNMPFTMNRTAADVAAQTLHIDTTATGTVIVYPY
jgi:hypothetical protein